MALNAAMLFNAGNLTLKDTSGQPLGQALVTDVEVSMEATTKSVSGPNLFAITSAITSKKVSGSFKMLASEYKSVAALVGGASAAGSTARAEVSVTAASSITPTVPASGTFVEDLGVLDATGKPMKYLSTGTAQVGEYKVAAGVYTFAAGETGTLTIRFSYHMAAVGGTVTVSQGTSGVCPAYSLTCFNEYTDANGTSQVGLKLFAISLAKFSYSTKENDFGSYSVSFEGYADPSTGKVYESYFSK